MSANPSAAARRAAEAYLREILRRPPFPPDIDRVARAIDATYKRIYPEAA